MSSPAIRIAVHIDPADHRTKQSLDKLAADIESRLSRIGAAMNRLDRPGTQSFFRQMERDANRSTLAISGLRVGLINLSAFLYASQRLGRIARSIFVDPFTESSKAILSATDRLRAWQVATSTALGSFNRARQVSYQLLAEARSSPLTSQQLLEASRSAVFQPQLAGRFGFGAPGRVAGQLRDYSEMVGRLGVLDPQQGPAGAAVAVREFLNSEVQSLRRRLEIAPRSISDAIGERLERVLADPELGLKALGQFAKTFVGDSSFAGQRDLFSNAMLKLADSVQQAFAAIGDRSGFYDGSVDRIRGLTDLILDSIDPAKNPKFNQQATRISDSLARIFDNAFDAVSGMLYRITGNRSPIENITEGFARMTEAGARLSDLLPNLAETFGIVGSGILKMIRGVHSVFQTGFETSVRVGGVNVPIEFGNAGHIRRLQQDIADAEAPGHGLSDQEVLQLWQKKNDLASMQRGDSSFIQSLNQLGRSMTFSELGRPYGTQRAVRERIESAMSGIPTVPPFNRSPAPPGVRATALSMRRSLPFSMSEWRRSPSRSGGFLARAEKACGGSAADTLVCCKPPSRTSRWPGEPAVSPSVRASDRCDWET